MKGLGVALATFAAVGIEVAEAALVVLVAASKGHRRVAWATAALTAVLVVVAAVAVGPRVLGLVPVDLLRQVVGGGLLLVGAFWTIQSAVRPDGAATELTHEMLTAQRWALRGPLATAVICGKAVLIEGTEAAVLVVAIGSPQRAFGAAWTGATAAVATVVVVATFAQRRLDRVTAPILNRIAGTVLAVLGTFWLADGSHLNVVLTASLPVVVGLGVAALWWHPKTRKTTQRQQQHQGNRG